MQAVELRIPGEYWDSFLYDDRLYLFTQDGDIRTYRWDRLIQHIEIDENCRPIFWQFLARGRAWYTPEIQALIQSPRIRKVLQALTDSVTAEPYYVSEKNLKASLIDVAPSPSHPHTDVEAYGNHLYLSSSRGIQAAQLKQPLEDSFDTFTDIPALRLACSYQTMAFAAGSDGMFEQSLQPEYYSMLSRRAAATQLSERLCVACNWVSFDVVATSGPGSSGYVAAFAKPSRDEDEERANRQLIGVVDSAEIFPTHDGLLFGAKNLLVMATRQSLVLDEWNPFRRRPEYGTDVSKTLLSRRQVKVDYFGDWAIDGAVTVYGLVVESDDSLSVIGSNGTKHALPEPTNWRTFPRSQRYLNHLHVTYDDHVRIYAFTSDYFTAGASRGPASRRPTGFYGRG